MLRVAIIGAGPAGSAAAIALAGRGVETTIVESRPFPRRKVCGEFVSPAATAILESLVEPAALRRAGAQRIGSLVLELENRSVSWPLPTPAWSLSRAALDSLLLERARAAGAHIVQPERVASVRYEAGGVRLILGGVGEIAAGVVIHADGAGRLDNGQSRPTPHRRGVLAHKCHLRLPFTLRGLHMRAARGAYIGLAGVGGGDVTCALVARRRLIKQHRGDADAMLRALWPGYDPAWRPADSPWMACGVPESGYIRPAHPRSFRIGNAAAAVEPVGGEGIGLALWSGVTLGGLLMSAPCTNESLLGVHDILERRYRARLRLRRPACRAAAAALMRPAVARAIWPLLAAPSLSIRPWYGLTGKPLAPVSNP